MSKTGGKKLVVVESPTKAKTIRKFLGKEYMIESCMGHVRDLPQSAKDIPEKYKKQKWAHLGVNVDDDFDPIYCVPKNKTKIVKGLKDKIAEADELILATDEDREGESISWHLVEVLKPTVPVKRMVFHEITKEAILDALKKFRKIDENLVRAQEARRILDRLVGYTISPLLWKKVAYGLSAGRVQSVAVRLIAEKEIERLKFKKAEYWSLTGENEKDKTSFETRLLSYNNKRVASGKDFDPMTGKLLSEKTKETFHLLQAEADRIEKELTNKTWKVTEVEDKPISRKPAAPFITSSLQQEANRKLGLTSRDTMQVAQKLYEQGFITYMRTDSTFLSQQAIDAARKKIEKTFGKKFLPDEARKYEGKKVKGAQEAHEAIRPAGNDFISPEDSGLRDMNFRLYELIYKRTLASQMANAQQKQMSVRFEVGNGVFAASGLTTEFAGFLQAYAEETDETEKDEENVKLPAMKVGDTVSCLRLKTNSHETKPPARFTEASLVQIMEKEGIGRPSTYAAIISTIQNRGYVHKVGNALVPTFTALVVTHLLSEYLPEYVDTQFTSGMEKSLDDIADGDRQSIEYLKSVYFGKKGLKETVERQDKEIDPETSRAIELPGFNNLSFRVGRYGAYVCRKEKGADVCASLPENLYPGDLTQIMADKLIDQKISGGDALGKDPASGLPVYVLTGRYGPYVQLGEAENKEAKPKRMSIPAGKDPATVTLPEALQLLSLPKKLGTHPTTDKVITAGFGRFGPYIVHDGDFRSIPKTHNIFEIDLAWALDMLSQPKKGRGRSTPVKELGAHPDTGEAVAIFDGKYGPYIKCGKVNASIQEDQKVEDVTLAIAVELLAPKMGGKSGGKKAKTSKATKAAATKEVATKVEKAPVKAKSTNATTVKTPAKKAKSTKVEAPVVASKKPASKVVRRATTRA